MIARAQLLLSPGETDGLPGPGGGLAGRRDLGDGPGHLGRDGHPGPGLQDVQEVVQLLSVAVTVAGGEGVKHRDLAGAGGSVEHWGREGVRKSLDTPSPVKSLGYGVLKSPNIFSSPHYDFKENYEIRVPYPLIDLLSIGF